METEEDNVYASILRRVEPPELAVQCQNVLQKECKTVDKRIRRLASSLTTLKQLQAASEYLRPTGDWRSTTLQKQLNSIEQLQREIEEAVQQMTMQSKNRTHSKKREPTETAGQTRLDGVEDVVTMDMAVEKETEVIEISDSEDEVIIVGVEVPEDEDPESEAVEVMEGPNLGNSNDNEGGVVDVGGETPKRIVLPEVLRGKATTGPKVVHMKTEIYEEESSASEVDLEAEFEPSMELEVLETSDEEPTVELEVLDSESAIELDVLDSESDEEFPSCLEMAMGLQQTSEESQIRAFPVVVDQLRSYLRHKHHFTVAELDGYLFAHKKIPTTELDEVALSLEAIISTGMRLPLRPQIKSALTKLLGTIKQFEYTLGELPALLQPAAKEFTDYLSTQVNSDIAATITDHFTDLEQV